MIRIKNFILVLIIITGIASCNKDKDKLIEEPVSHEPELITTIRIKATKVGGNNEVTFFKYKVENGFHGGGTALRADPIILDAGTVYDIEMFVLDEQNSPTIDVTEEIIQEKNSHLFYYVSTPETGSGSIKVSDRDKDDNGQDFARVCKWQTGSSGKGELKITLIHGPRNKEAPTRETIAGATDAEAVFKVTLN